MNALKSEIEKQFYTVHTAWNETDKVYAIQLGKPSKAMANWITVIDDPSDPEFPSVDPNDVDFPIRVEHSDIDLCAELFLGRCQFLIRSGGLKTDLNEIKREVEFGIKKYK